jgi:hypothetical protein
MRREGRRGPPPGRRIRARDGVGEAAGVEMSRSMGGGGEKIEETSEVGTRERMMCGNFFWTRRG